MSQADFDVIVIGGGGAGMSAAIMAAQAGAKVFLVDAGADLGGATALSSGAFYAAATQVQRDAGVLDDTPKAMYNYAMALNQYRMVPSVLKRFCDEGGETLDWLIGLGVEFKRLSPSDLTGSGIPRSHWAQGGGAGITQVLEGHLQSAGVEVATRTRVQQLVVEAGAVVGIEADGAVIRANAVIVASGGFGANDEKLARYFPEADAAGRWYVGPDTSQGDALDFGQAIGADIYGENTGLQLMSPGLDKMLEVPPGWLILVNRHGQRFVNEDAAYGIHNTAVSAQPGRVAYAIFDQAAFDDTPQDFRFAPLIAAGELGTVWRHDTLAAALAAGKILKGDTLDELAATAGISAAALVETVALYNDDVATGTDGLHFKNPLHLRRIGAGPYYAAVMTMRVLGLTSCGLRIDRDARVQDAAGKAIPGLYAAGEASGGLMGKIYFGSGNAIANAIVFGRIAGDNAARYAQTNSLMLDRA